MEAVGMGQEVRWRIIWSRVPADRGPPAHLR
jgi:hypothetical protein